MQIAVIACVTAVLAAGALTKQASTVFKGLDLDGDNFISKEESAVNIQVAAMFSKLDVNQDGKLSTKEFAAFNN